MWIWHWRQEKRNANYPFTGLFKSNSNHKASLVFLVQRTKLTLFSAEQPYLPNLQTSIVLFYDHLSLASWTLGLGWRRGSTAKCRVPKALSNYDRRGKKWPECDQGIRKVDSQIEKTEVFLQIGTLNTWYKIFLAKARVSSKADVQVWGEYDKKVKAFILHGYVMELYKIWLPSWCREKRVQTNRDKLKK